MSFLNLQSERLLDWKSIKLRFYLHFFHIIGTMHEERETKETLNISKFKRYLDYYETI